MMPGPKPKSLLKAVLVWSLIFVPPVVTEDAAGAAVLVTVVLLFVVSAFVNEAWTASIANADAAAKECLKFLFRAA